MPGPATERARAFNNYVNPVYTLLRFHQRTLKLVPGSAAEERYRLFKATIREALKEELNSGRRYDGVLGTVALAVRKKMEKKYDECRRERLSERVAVEEALELLPTPQAFLTAIGVPPADIRGLDSPQARASISRAAEEENDSDHDLFFHPDPVFARQMQLEPDDPNGYHANHVIPQDLPRSSYPPEGDPSVSPTNFLYGSLSRSLGKGDAHRITSRSALAHGFEKKHWERAARRYWSRV
ncbi:hypothetical protein JCM8547_002819 [Rhodosporidiobolus lusitaniae]